MSASAPSLRFVSAGVSPWSERARWALDHHQLVYRPIEHVPFIHERRLRRMLGGRPGRVTVPVLFVGDTAITESWDIAVYADSVGGATPLVPRVPIDREAEVRRWVELADRTSAQGRALVTAALLASPAAIDETLPPEVPGWVRPLLRPIGRFGLRWFARKYELRFDERVLQEQAIREALTTVRAALHATSSGGSYLLGTFSYADIAIATVLQSVVPVDGPWIRLGPATRAAWTHPALAEEFADLVRWRDQLYRLHRATRVTPPKG